MFIQDTVGNKQEFVSLGLYCADVCKALDRGLNGKRSEELSKSVHGAIEQLRAWVEPATRTMSGPFNKLSVAELSERSREMSTRSATRTCSSDSYM